MAMNALVDSFATIRKSVWLKGLMTLFYTYVDQYKAYVTMPDEFMQTDSGTRSMHTSMPCSLGKQRSI